MWTKHNFYLSATDAICKQTPVWDHPADRHRDLPISKSGVPVGFRSTAGDTKRQTFSPGITQKEWTNNTFASGTTPKCALWYVYPYS